MSSTSERLGPASFAFDTWLPQPTVLSRRLLFRVLETFVSPVHHVDMVLQVLGLTILPKRIVQKLLGVAPYIGSVVVRHLCSFFGILLRGLFKEQS
jgi:hypothetical protein